MTENYEEVAAFFWIVLFATPLLAVVVFLFLVFICMKLGIIKINGELPNWVKPIQFKRRNKK